VAGAISNHHGRAIVLARLVPQLPDAERRTALRDARAAAKAISDRADRAGALTALVPHFPGGERQIAPDPASPSNVLVTYKQYLAERAARHPPQTKPQTAPPVSEVALITDNKPRNVVDLPPKKEDGPIAMDHVVRAIFQPAADYLGLPVEVLWKAGKEARAKAARSLTQRAKAKPRPTRPQFRERTGDDLKLSPPEFIKIVYAQEISAKTLHKGLIHREDAGLYTDLHNWLRDRENKIPDDLDLPTFKEWNSRRLADPATREAMRLREVEKGRMKAGEAQRPVGRPRKADRRAAAG
jgi:hypothetical protein